MKGNIFNFLLCLPFLLMGLGDSYAQSSNICLHTDRDYYLPGDTVWFKGYFLKEGAIARNLHNLYIKLINNEGNEMWRSVALINDGVTASYFRIPPDYSGSEIFINANTLLDSCPDSRPYLKKIGILHLSESGLRISDSISQPHSDVFNISVYPEGGCLLSNLENKLIIRSSDNRGYPSIAKGKLVDDEGLLLSNFETDSAGLASIESTFPGERLYTLHWTDANGANHQNEIQRSIKGTKVMLIEQDSQILIQLRTNLASQTIRVVADLGKRHLFDQTLTLIKDKKVNIPLKKADLEYGILRTHVLNDQEKVISRNSLLVGAKEIQISPIVTINSTFKEKSEGRVLVKLPNGERIAKLSVSVVDAEIGVDTSNNILSDIYFQPLSPQQMLYPQILWKFTSDKNLFVQSQDWDYSYCPTSGSAISDSLLTIRGQIKLRDKSWEEFYRDYKEEVKKGEKRKLPPRVISFGYQSPDETQMRYSELKFDRDGNFEVPGLIVFDSLLTKVVQVYRKLKFTPFTVRYQFANHRNFRYPPLISLSSTGNRLIKLDNRMGIRSDYFKIDAQGKRVLQVVEVSRTKRQREIDRLQKRFKSMEPFTVHEPDLILLPLMDSVVIKQSQSLREYISRNIMAKDVNIILNGKAVAIFRGNNKDKLSQLDQELELSFLEEDVSNYPYMKFYRTYNSAESVGGKNVLVVFSYSSAEINRDLGAEEYRDTIAGYMPIKKYSNKMYPSRTSQLASGVDTRLTLYWDPFFDFTQDDHAKEFVFYNSSLSKGVWVTITGLTETGKVVYYRKMIK